MECEERARRPERSPDRTRRSRRGRATSLCEICRRQPTSRTMAGSRVVPVGKEKRTRRDGDPYLTGLWFMILEEGRDDADCLSKAQPSAELELSVGDGLTEVARGMGSREF